MVTARGPLPEASEQDVKRWRPRFPLEWLDEVELDGRFTRHFKKAPRWPPKMRRRWSLILLGAVLAAMVVPTWLSEQGLSPANGTLPHTRWTEGVIEEIGPGQNGALTVTVVGMGGKSATAALTFSGTSVYQEGQVRHIGHLRLGQHVQLVQVKDRARTIEILY